MGDFTGSVSTLKIGELTTRVVQYGPEDGARVLVLHSAGLTAHAFESFAEELVRREGFRVVAFDQRGHGLSSAHGDDVSLQGMAEDVAAVIDALTLGRVHLLGHSVGGAVAGLASLLRPDSIRSLTIAASPLIGLPSFAERAQAARQGGMDTVIESTLSRWFNPSDRQQDIAAVSYARTSLQSMSAEDWAKLWDSFAKFQGFQASDTLPPVFCLVGECDRSTPPAVVGKIGSILGAEDIAVIAGAPHQLFLTHPEAVAEAWAAWASKTAP
jgi:pimeloyl-ACP methyl ester carboxylesterase